MTTITASFNSPQQLVAIELKENDVFSFRYNEDELKKRSYPYHCFDGTLIARKRNDESIRLTDTYWGGSDSKVFTTDEAQKQGCLTFICNLSEVDKCLEGDKLYYDEADFITLYIHAGYRNQNYLKRGAIRSKEKMLQSVKQKIETEEGKKRYAESEIERLQKVILKIESGDLTEYI